VVVLRIGSIEEYVTGSGKVRGPPIRAIRCSDLFFAKRRAAHHDELTQQRQTGGSTIYVMANCAQLRCGAHGDALLIHWSRVPTISP
jgi:hypothetical protein